MSAVIEIQTAEGAIPEHWIEKNVVRVGSGEKCEVRIEAAGMPNHALTIRFHDGEYVVYNRTEQPVALADRVIQPEESSVWRANDLLRLTAGISLTLVITGDPSPAPRPMDNAVLQAYRQKRAEQRRQEAIKAESAGKKQDQQQLSKLEAGKKRSAVMQTIVGVVCLLVAVGIGTAMVLTLLMPAGQSTEGNPELVAEELLNLDRDGKLPATTKRLIALLQEAQQAVDRRDAELAKPRLKQLRAEVSRLRSEGTPLCVQHDRTTIDYYAKLDKYINTFLAQLEESSR